MRIGMTYDLRSDYLALGYSEADTAEFDSDLTIRAIEDAIAAFGALPVRIGHARALINSLEHGERWDLVFNIAEGLQGRSREAQVPAILELYGIPYTFSDPLVCAVTLDKAVTKQLVRSHGLPTADFAVARSVEDLASVALPYPLFAKPLAEGTGKGISTASRVGDTTELRRTVAALLQEFNQPVLIETYLPGREFTVGITGNGAQANVLGMLEVLVQASHDAVYSYENKENWQKLVHYGVPGEPEVAQAVSQLALASYHALDCRDAARVDIRLDTGGTPNFLEVNPLPGLNPIHSDLPMIAYRAGVTYRELIGRVIQAALARQDGA
ncbi:MAG: D-alanine--D-alanine ligase [Chloroflexi bacterium]|nr:D-alanine--D-alanine ligase [Chloroflexota bacterium]